VAHARLDRSLGVLRGGYPYLLQLRRRWSANSLELRLMGRRATVLSGPAGTRLFYDESAMRRRGAVPAPIRRTLFGSGAVHGLDDAPHKHRKALFVQLLTPAAAREIAAEAAELWPGRAGPQLAEPAAVFDAAVQVHCAAACRWAGVPAERVDLTLGHDLMAMVDGFGALGARHLRARRGRRRAERWARRLVTLVRGGHCSTREGSPLDVIARYPRLDGRPLPVRVAAVELINVLRPTVAVAYFVAFAAHALADADLRARLRSADEATYEAFAHELRRYYPFVPMLAARTRRPIEIGGRPVPAGRRVILDVYGTLHDPQLWAAPEHFDLDRFAGVRPDEWTYVPQGGGDVATGHRCPGERVAVELIKTAAAFLLTQPAGEPMPYSMTRMPTRPLP
jgi:fatty-acid peroxygenase